MQTLKQEYIEFLKNNFKGLVIKEPLFYNWKFGLRFNLQVDETNTDEYFEQVRSRATTLFLNCFDPSDQIYLVYMDYKHKRGKIRINNYCFKQIKELNKSEIHYLKARRLHEPTDKFDITNVAIIKLTTNRINFGNILTAIGNSDFPARQPRLDKKGVGSSKNIFFINTTRKIIFNMYDDRGLDIIATDIETLRSLYEKHKNWLLEYDLTEMDKRMQMKKD